MDFPTLRKRLTDWFEPQNLEEALSDLPDGLLDSFTAVFFAGGVVFDALTLGRNINLWKLGYVGLYVIAFSFGMALRTHNWLDWNQKHIDWGLHFCLGATFSPLIVFYFRSASHLWTFLTVLGLAGAMIWNELAARGDPDQALVWGIYGVGLVMYLNFLFPYLLGVVTPWLFYFSIAATLIVLGGFYATIDIPARSLVGVGAFSILLAILYFLGAIPPVPLVMEQSRVCTNARHQNGKYICDGTRRSFVVKTGLATPVVRYQSGDRLSVMSAVGAPHEVNLKVEHRWYYWRNGDWVHTDTIDLSMTGGRESGWRFYSYKENYRPGFWKVATALSGGAVLSYELFRAKPASAPSGPDTIRYELK